MPRYLLDDERARRLAAYLCTPSDAAAARRLGLSRVTFRAWSVGAGLPTMAPNQNRLSPADQAEREALFEEASSDADLARRIGIQDSSIAHWRRRHGIVAKKPRPSYTDEQRVQAYLTSATDNEAAVSLGSCRDSAGRWRRRHELPAKNGAGPPPDHRSDKHRRWWHAYCLTTSAREAAGMVGSSEVAMLRWMRRHGLPHNSKQRKKKQAILQAATQGDPIALDAAMKRRWINDTR